MRFFYIVASVGNIRLWCSVLWRSWRLVTTQAYLKFNWRTKWWVVFIGVVLIFYRSSLKIRAAVTYLSLIAISFFLIKIKMYIISTHQIITSLALFRRMGLFSFQIFIYSFWIIFSSWSKRFFGLCFTKKKLSFGFAAAWTIIWNIFSQDALIAVWNSDTLKMKPVMACFTTKIQK